MKREWGFSLVVALVALLAAYVPSAIAGAGPHNKAE